MAASGYKEINATPDGLIKLRFSWSAGTQNIANNYTPVSWTLTLRSTNPSAHISASAAKDYSVIVDGETKTGTNNVTLNGGATKTLASGSKNIYHNSDGTKTFSYSFSQKIGITYSGTRIETKSGNGTGTLNTIPRGSVLGSIANFTIGNAITIPITKYADSFSDTLNIYVGNTWIKRVEGLTNNQSVSFTAAELNNIYAAIPTATTATFRFVNSTYSGATVIGTSTTTATGTINANIVPTISRVTVDEIVANIETQFGFLVQNKSMLGVTISATPGAGSSIDSYEIAINGSKYVSSAFTTEVLTTSGSNLYVVTVKGKRGRSALVTGTFNVTAYTSPTISKLNVIRCLEDGTEDDAGGYAKINASASITSLSNKNTKSFKLQYKLKTATEWTTIETYTSGYTYTVTNKIVANINPDYPYEFRIVATDFFDEVPSKTISLSSGYTILDIKADGKGMAFGGVSAKNGYQFIGDVLDKFDTKINNGLSVYRPNGVEVDPDTTLEELVLTETNTPGGFHYIRTMFYATKSATANRTQIAYPYAYDSNTKKALYTRAYVDGLGWSEWAFVGSDVNAEDYAGLFQSGKQLLESGWVTITPTAANTPTAVNVAFKKAYNKIPVVLPVASSGVIGTQVLGASVNGISKTSVNIVLTRINTTPTTVYYFVLGEV